MANAKITALTANTTPATTDIFPMVDDPSGSPSTQKMTFASLLTIVNSLSEDTSPSAINDFVMSYDASASAAKKIRLAYLLGLLAPEGYLINGRISPTVSANDLVLNIVTLAGTTPSASDPVFVKINNTLRTITAATTMTLADGTNWFNSGRTSLATKEIDYFAYAVYDSNSSVVAISAARIPYGKLVSDFSSTTTNEKYLGNYANFTSTDTVVNIGRFAATLSAGAGYTWTVPTYTNINKIDRPIYETRVLTYSPAYTNITLGNGTNDGKYMLSGNQQFFMDVFTFGSTSSIGGDIAIELPFAISSSSSGLYVPHAQVQILDSGTATYQGQAYGGTGSTSLTCRVINTAGTYANITTMSSTVPMTWATNDLLNMFGWSFIS